MINDESDDNKNKIIKKSYTWDPKKLKCVPLGPSQLQINFSLKYTLLDEPALDKISREDWAVEYTDRG